MRVFATGATGFIGSAIAQELMRAGHQVVGLARNDEAAEALARMGAEVHRGDLSDPDSLAHGARAADGVIHTGYIHDFSNIAQSGETDAAAVQAMVAAMEGSGKPFVNTSGVAVLTPGRVGTEEDEPDPASPSPHRIASEKAGLAAARRGVRATVVRPGASVHGDGDHGFVPMLIDVARSKRLSAYVGDGSNRWPAVHRLDAAVLFRLALEKGRPGGRYHAVGDEGVPYRAIAEVIGRRLGVPARSLSPDDAKEHFGGFVGFVAMDEPGSSARTQAELGWRPTQPGLLADIDRPEYYSS